MKTQKRMKETQARMQGRDKGRNWDTQEWSYLALLSVALWCFIRRVSAIVTITRLSAKVSLKSLGQTEDSWFSSIRGKNTRLQKII